VNGGRIAAELALSLRSHGVVAVWGTTHGVPDPQAWHCAAQVSALQEHGNHVRPLGYMDGVYLDKRRPLSSDGIAVELLPCLEIGPQ
jgi:hypothetical protein